MRGGGGLGKAESQERMKTTSVLSFSCVGVQNADAATELWGKIKSRAGGRLIGRSADSALSQLRDMRRL